MDPFASFQSGLSSPATRHFTITPADENLPIRPRFIRAEQGGCAVLHDDGGTSLHYEFKTGETLPFRAVRVSPSPRVTDFNEAPPVLIGLY